MVLSGDPGTLRSGDACSRLLGLLVIEECPWRRSRILVTSSVTSASWPWDQWLCLHLIWLYTLQVQNSIWCQNNFVLHICWLTHCSSWLTLNRNLSALSALPQGQWSNNLITAGPVLFAPLPVFSRIYFWYPHFQVDNTREIKTLGDH